MKWQAPYFLWLIILLLPIFVFELISLRKRYYLYRLQSNRSLLLTYLKTALLGFGTLFLIMALAGPRYGIIPQTQSLSGLEIVFALDVSDSMRAKDIAESRLKKSISEIQKILLGLNSDLAGFVTFEGSATVVCPLTQDYDALNYFLNGVLDYREETPGTNLSTAFNEALKIFNFKSDTAKVLIYFTDGENNQGNLNDLKAKALKNNILILPVGVGQTQGTTIVSGTGVLIDRNGSPVITRLELNSLKQIATRKVFVIKQSYQSVAGELLNEIQNFQRRPFNAQNINQYQSYYALFTGLALLCLFLSLALPATKMIFRNKTLFLLLFVFFPPALLASPLTDHTIRAGNRLFDDQKYQKAIETYDKTNDLRARLNSALAYEELGQFKESENIYQSLLGESGLSKFERTRLLYNLGNLYAKQNKTLAAQQAYIESLKVDPSYKPARQNLEWLLKIQKKQKQPKKGGQEPVRANIVRPDQTDAEIDAARALDNFKNGEQENIIKQMQGKPRKENVEKYW